MMKFAFLIHFMCFVGVYLFNVRQSLLGKSGPDWLMDVDDLS